MAPRASLEDRLAELRRVGELGPTDAGLATVRKALAARENVLVGRAAQIAGQWESSQLVDALDAAFSRFLVNPVRTDPGCRAKAPIVEALYTIGAPSADVFLVGVRHVQMEPSFGGPEDTASKLRGLCAVGLIRMNHPEALKEAAWLLADAEADARIMAARALGYSGDPRGEPVLWHKLRQGDEDPRTLAECYLALLQLAPEEVDFVAGDVNAADLDRAQAAATALGESRRPEAFEPLREAATRTIDAERRAALLFAIAALRTDESVAWLLDRLADSEGEQAETLLTALSTYRHDPAVRQRVADLVDRRRDRDLSRAYRTSFGE